jgi:ATP-dependent DNA helicase RecG
LGNDARERIHTMVTTANGFEIAEKDLQLRGPGEIDGTKQSGALNFKLASIVNDREVLELSKNIAASVLDVDPDLNSAGNLPLKNFLNQSPQGIIWSKIS